MVKRKKSYLWARSGSCTGDVRAALAVSVSPIGIKQLAGLLDWRYESAEISACLVKMLRRGEVTHIGRAWAKSNQAIYEGSGSIEGVDRTASQKR